MKRQVVGGLQDGKGVSWEVWLCGKRWCSGLKLGTSKKEEEAPRQESTLNGKNA